MSDEYEGYPPDFDPIDGLLYVSLVDSEGGHHSVNVWTPGKAMDFVACCTGKTLTHAWLYEDDFNGDPLVKVSLAAPVLMREGDTATITLGVEVL